MHYGTITNTKSLLYPYSYPNILMLCFSNKTKRSSNISLVGLICSLVCAQDTNIVWRIVFVLLLHIPRNFVMAAFFHSGILWNFHSIMSFHVTAEREFMEDDTVLTKTKTAFGISKNYIGQHLQCWCWKANWEWITLIIQPHWNLWNMPGPARKWTLTLKFHTLLIYSSKMIWISTKI